MSEVVASYDELLGFLELAGGVGWPLVFLTLLMWTLIIDRLWYTTIEHRKKRDHVVAAWNARTDRSSWTAKQIRRLRVSELMTQYERGLVVLRSVIAVCPLMGLLGTVMGMLGVFDVVATSGNGNVRALAAGVSEATVSTMIGMVVALSGLYFGERLRRGAAAERRRLEDALTSA